VERAAEGRRAPPTKVEGLRLGVDDYVTKPFSIVVDGVAAV
jgi:DNA-binding response OmpR family regulator